ncbi:hypothetical protein A1O3_01955 [Capronia epimyces CBS 606.96]|uniref:Clr5 domain-containing protein n=1 Tax=Capronia epimyces CBS 606.96 TaxID=1182542 RepID=W9YI31_9EURO|nr:uncharacterized protein A1O3_01955 [Capronia epimyces CBS 606.96]EXJ88891.1 hypothetical protein A1O3_01955 [Capronia epimyces CBS 606.96]
MAPLTTTHTNADADDHIESMIPSCTPLLSADAANPDLEEDQWNEYEQVLRHLHGMADKSLQDIMEYMKQTFGFEKSEGQYKRKFKSWGLRTNVKSHEWKFVAHRLQKRKKSGKNESNVYAHGVLQPAKRVRTETRRHGWQSTSERIASAQSPKTPEGIQVLTPTDTQNSRFATDLDLLWYKVSIYQVPNLSPGLLAVKITGDLRLSNGWNVVLSPNVPTQVANKLNSYLRALLPNTPENELQARQDPLAGKDLLTSPAELVKILLFAISNHLTDGEAVAKVLSMNSRPSQERALLDCLSIKNPTLQAFGERLFKASIIRGHCRLMTEFLRRGADPNIRITREGCSALRHCVEITDLMSCKKLLEFGADVNAMSTFENAEHTPLQAAAARGHCEVVRLLLRYGADPNAHSADSGGTALQCALLKNDTLLEAGADINGLDRYKNNVITIALNRNGPKVVQFLLQAGADPCLIKTDKLGRVLLQKAVTRRDSGLLCHVWTLGSPVERYLDLKSSWFSGQRAWEHLQVATGETILLLYECLSQSRPPKEEEYFRSAAKEAIQRGDLHTFAGLLKAAGRAEIDLDIPPEPGVRVRAWIEGSSEEFRYLLEAAADYNDSSIESCLECVLEPLVRHKDYETFHMMLRTYRTCFATTDSHADAIGLFTAASCGDMLLMESYVLAGVDVSTPSIVGTLGSPLEAVVSCERGDFEETDEVAEGLIRFTRDDMVRWLISMGATVDDKILRAMIKSENSCYVETFIESGVDLLPSLDVIRTLFQERDTRGSADDVESLFLLLTYDSSLAATRFGSLVLYDLVADDYHDIATLLLETGGDQFDVNFNDGTRTLLQIAIIEGELELVRCLLKAGADPDATARQARTPLQLAAAMGEKFASFFACQAIRLLLDKDADVDKRAYGEWSALQYASRYADGRAQMILDAGLM